MATTVTFLTLQAVPLMPLREADYCAHMEVLFFSLLLTLCFTHDIFVTITTTPHWNCAWLITQDDATAFSHEEGF